MERADGRKTNELRPVEMTADFTKFAEGSVLIRCGDTVVLCNASVEDRVPPHVRPGHGWVTAEYSMLPRANRERSKRDISKLKLSPRSAEIQRLGGRSRESILADATESVIAACFLDGGLEAALQVVRTFILVEVPVTKLHNADYKTELQELVQRKPDQTLRYEMVGSSGPDHARVFAFRVLLNGQVAGTGEGRSKKEAEQAAAHCALERLTQ